VRTIEYELRDLLEVVKARRHELPGRLVSIDNAVYGHLVRAMQEERWLADCLEKEEK